MTKIMDAGYIKQACRQLNDRLIDWRRHLHRIPEIGIDLPETEAAVRSFLEPMAVELQPGYEGIGVVALVRGRAGDGPTLAVRADMDALEVQEETGFAFASCYPGRMHACGHDAHTAIALGAVKFLAEHRENFSGTVKFIFQPGEECMDGAQKMIEAGVMENPKVGAVLGLHIGGLWDELAAGQIGTSDRPTMAAADAFDFSITAGGGHGAYPHQSPDPVLAASLAIVQIHTLVSRAVDPVDTAVITVGRVEGGQARNIIPTEVRAEGTVRTLREEVRKRLEKRIGEVVEHAAGGQGCGHSYTFHRAYPPVKSDPAMAELVDRAARDLFGDADVRRITRPSLAGEDVALFLNRVPGCFFGLGGSNPAKGILSNHHSPTFAIDEEVLWRGTATFCLAALRWLERS